MNRLKEIRRRCGLSGQGLAVKAGLSTATVTGIERWDHLPTAVTRERIAQALKVSESDIWPELASPQEEAHRGGEANVTE